MTPLFSGYPFQGKTDHHGFLMHLLIYRLRHHNSRTLILFASDHLKNPLKID